MADGLFTETELFYATPKVDKGFVRTSCKSEVKQLRWKSKLERFWLLSGFLELPKKAATYHQHHELRAHKSFKCGILAQTRVDRKPRGGVIENFSEGGCDCVVEIFPTENHRPWDWLNDTIPLRCHFPGSKGEVSFKAIKNINK